MRRTLVPTLLGPLLCVAAGCSGGAPTASFSDVRRLAAERAGKDVRWDRGGPEDLGARQAVRTLLATDLDVEGAVQVALLNNRSLQATFEEIGIAQADLVQSGLLRNPLFHLGAQYGTGGATGIRLDYSAAFAFIDLLRIPMRRRVAAIDLQRATLRAADAVLTLARDVRTAYWTLQARAQVLEVQQTALAALDAAAELSGRQHAAGNVSDLDRIEEEDVALLAKIEVTRAQAQVESDREALNRLMGLCGPETQWRLSPRMPGLPGADPTLDDLERRAVCQRLDLAAARAELRAIAAGLPLTSIDPWAASEFGLSGERDADGENHVGPDLTLELPIFDTGRAAAARESARYRQAKQRYLALEVAIRSEVREARARLLAARQVVTFFYDVWLPRKMQATSLWQERYNAMLEGTFRLLRAKGEEIDAGRDAIEALRDYWIARAELERAAGGRLPLPLPVSSSTPAVESKPEPAAPRPPAPLPPPASPAPPHTQKHGG